MHGSDRFLLKTPLRELGLFYFQNDFYLLFIYFIFICDSIITKKYKKRRKKKWRGDLTETIGDYERLGLLELRARAVSHQLKKRWRKVEDGKIYELFSYLLNNLIFSFFLKRGKGLRVDDLNDRFRWPIQTLGVRLH